MFSTAFASLSFAIRIVTTIFILSCHFSIKEKKVHVKNSQISYLRQKEASIENTNFLSSYYFLNY
ncbi:hypothetical protein BOVMAS18_10290 [Streptococcus uberis]